MLKYPILFIYILLLTCERPSKADGQETLDTPCFSLRAADGFDDFICGGVKANMRPGPKGEKGDRGGNGSPGAQGPIGPSGGSRILEKSCHLLWPEGTGNYDVTYMTFKDADGSRDVMARIIQTGPDEGVFSNSSTYLLGEPLFETAPVNIEGFEIKLVNPRQAYIRFRPNGRNETFDCK